MKRLNYSVPALALSVLLLGACAKSSSPLRTEYQTRANTVLAGFTQNVSRAFTKKNGSSSARGAYATASVTNNLTFGNWNVYNQPYGGYLISNNQDQNAARCVEMVQYIPEEAANFDVMAATLARCLMQMSIYKNPLMTYSLSNLNSSGMDMAGYLNSYALGGQYQQGSYGAVQPYLMYGNTSQPIYWNQSGSTGSSW